MALQLLARIAGQTFSGGLVESWSVNPIIFDNRR
jgi:hypothetical protein